MGSSLTCSQIVRARYGRVRARTFGSRFPFGPADPPSPIAPKQGAICPFQGANFLSRLCSEIHRRQWQGMAARELRVTGRQAWLVILDHQGHTKKKTLITKSQACILTLFLGAVVACERKPPTFRRTNEGLRALPQSIETALTSHRCTP